MGDCVHKTNKTIIGILLTPFVVLGIFVAYCYVKEINDRAEGKRQITSYLESQHLPKDQSVILEERYDNKLFSTITYFFKITTKKDYENWKKEILSTKKFLNGKPVNKDYEPVIKDCEIEYDFIYDVKAKQISFDYSLSGNWVSDKKIIENIFSYPDIPYNTTFEN